MKARGGSMYQTHIHIGAIIAGKEKDAETRGKAVSKPAMETEGSGVAGEGRVGEGRVTLTSNKGEDR